MPGCNLLLGGGSFFNGVLAASGGFRMLKLCAFPVQGRVPMMSELPQVAWCQMLLLGQKFWWELGCW